MTSVTFISAASLSLEDVTEAFNLGFQAYHFPMTQTPDGLAQMMRENDVRLDDSVALYVDGRVAGVGLVAVRDTRGWIAGMGVAPAWRGQGIGARLLGRLLDTMRERGLRVAQLEALDVNTPAIALYQRMGFVTRRKLTVYHGPPRMELTRALAAETPRSRVRAVAPRLAFRSFDAFHQVQPAWQRERATLERVRGAVDGLGLWDGAHLSAYLLYAHQSVGYAILDAGSGAPEPTARRDDIAHLLSVLTAATPESTVRAINSPPGDALGAALDLLGCSVAVVQSEMTLGLS